MSSVPIPAGATIGDSVPIPSNAQIGEQQQPQSPQRTAENPLALPSNMSVSAQPQITAGEVFDNIAQIPIDPLGEISKGLDLLRQRLGESEHPAAQAVGQKLSDAKELLVGGQSVGKPMGTKSGVLNNPVTIAMSGAVGGEEAAPKLEEAAKGAVSRGAEAVSKAIPSTERAGEAFEEVKGAAGKIPVDVTEPEKIAIETQRLGQSGGVVPKVIRDWLKRTEHVGQPVTYEEARDFYSNATRLSSDEAQKMTPVMKKQVSRFTDALRTATKDAAGEAGKADKFEGAMKEYAAAKRMENRKEFVKDLVYQGVKNGLKYGTALYIADKLWRGEQ